MQISGFTIIRNATRLDFPLEASIRSVLPAVDEMIVNVGESEDDTLDRVRAIADPRLRVLQTTWDSTRGPAMLADETQRAMAACRSPWGIYIQADEVLGDGGAALIRATIERCDPDPRIEGVLVEYRHFYGGFTTVVRNRKWYRREVRAVRLGGPADVRSYRDAQGFRAGPAMRRIRAVASGAVMSHYGWARPSWALDAKRSEDIALDPARRGGLARRPLVPWIPGLERFDGEHPQAVREWIAARDAHGQMVAARRFEAHHLRLMLSGAIEHATGWRPFEFRNYVEAEEPPQK